MRFGDKGKRKPGLNKKGTLEKKTKTQWHKKMGVQLTI